MNKPAPDTPFTQSAATVQRVRDRAMRMWEAEGRPEGREDDYLERARELVVIETNPPLPLPPPSPAQPPHDPAAPPIEDAVLQTNLGEFPGRFTDQGDSMPTPETREIARQYRDGDR